MKYLILGAGPAGLSFAYRLLKNGEQDFLILEKESEAGGLCRSKEVDGAPLDIGGGHFVDVRNKEVLNFLFELMPECEWNRFERNSQIKIYNQYINSPIEANVWQLPIDKQVEYLKSIAVAGCNTGKEKPEKFVEWIYWKLGEKIANDYMIPYNQKMFGENLDVLGTYWLEKLPDVSFEETLRSCLERKAYGKQPGHAEFYYPKKYGSGEVWLRFAEKLAGKIEYDFEINELNVKNHSINGKYSAQNIVTTIPWTEFKTIVDEEQDYGTLIDKLKYSSIVVDYVAEEMNTDAHWIYYPEQEQFYHRILVRSSFCEGKGYWTETNSVRFKEQEMRQTTFYNKYAYPMNTLDKPDAIKQILSSMRRKGIYGLGRWGEWEHYNSDVVVKKAIDLADKFIMKSL